MRVKHQRWTIAFTTPPAARPTPGTGVVGIDRGVANTLSLDDGRMMQAPSWTPAEQARFVRLQQQLARQVKGSKRRQRTLDAIGRLHLRLTDRRTDWVEQTTTALAREFATIAIEDLNIPGMTRRPAPKPDLDQPGQYLPNNARAKAGLNRAILASVWGQFARRLADKTSVIVVPAPGTSQECRACEHRAPENRENQADFRCVDCGHTAHADTNAAQNIRLRGLKLMDAGQAVTRRTNPTRGGPLTTHPTAA